MRGSVPLLFSAFLAAQAALVAAGEFEFEAQRFPEAVGEYADEGTSTYAEGPHGPGCSCRADAYDGCCGHEGRCSCNPCGCGAC